MLPNVMPKLSEVPVGAEDKNRYANVIPCKLFVFLVVYKRTDGTIKMLKN